jgi:hypothetical protein
MEAVTCAAVAGGSKNALISPMPFKLGWHAISPGKLTNVASRCASLAKRSVSAVEPGGDGGRSAEHE